MELVYVDHDNQSIFSIHVDPKRQRLATASSDAKIKIWSTGPLTSTEAENNDKAHPRLLATLIEHTAPVNAVRFSPDGRLLASCSDDQTAALYEQRPGVGMLLGEKPNLENWKQISRLKGHSNNVMDIAWAPDGSKLATCSLDNSVIVWNSAGRQVVVLDGHKSYVKGLAWDPIGTYLASQSDDRSIIIWRCSDWNIIQRITSPFEQNFVTSTFSLRLSWSPDGQYLMGANMFDPPKHGAVIAKRGSWKADLSAMGHKAPVTVISYSPVLYHSGDDAEPDYCFAFGSQDKKITVWQSMNSRPSTIITSTFQQSITDLAWSSDGQFLAASSTDGTLAVIQFENGIFGKALTAEEKQAYLDKKYGGAKASGLDLIEDVAMLELGGIAEKPAEKSQAPPKIASPQQAPVRPQANGSTAQSEKARSLGERTLMGAPLVVENQARRRIAPPTAHTPLAQNQAPFNPRTPGTQPPRGHLYTGHIPPPVPKAITVKLGLDELLGFTTEVKLNVANNGNNASISCYRGADLHWKDQVRGEAVAACGNLNFSAVALLQGPLYIYSAAGRRLLSQLLLQGPPHFLCASQTGWILMAVLLSDNTLRLWNLQTLELKFSASIRQFSNTQVVGASLTKSGCPILYLLDGSAHLLHPKLQEWLTVSSPSFAASPFMTQLPASGELAVIEQQTLSKSQLNPFNTPSNPSLSRRHLESKLSASLALESAEEYKQWLLAYASNLSGEGDEAALKELCSDLLGPLRATEEACNESAWQPKCLGLHKHDLLRCILQETARHRRHQRLVADFSEQLKAFEVAPQMINES